MTAPAYDPALRPLSRVARELAENTGFLLARLGVAFKAKAVERVEQEGSDPHHYSVLAILEEGARETQGTIAEALGLDPSRMVAVLDSLEQEGLVERRRDPLDRRRHTVSITPAGRKQLRRLRAIAKQLEEELLAPLTPEDRVTFHRLLVQLAVRHDPSCAFEETA
jgi:MarR family transcriptional regulator, lower aerobic nicotinate degradation pathway regulator